MLSEIGHIEGLKYLYKYLEHEAEEGRHSRWFGKEDFLNKLGLDSERNTTLEEAYLLAEGFHPKTKEPLTTNAGAENRRKGYTTSLNDPKPFSVKLECADKPLREELITLKDQAIKETLQYIQDNFVYGRDSASEKSKGIADLFERKDFEQIVIGRAFELNEAGRKTIAEDTKTYTPEQLEEALGDKAKKYNLGRDFKGDFKLPIQLTKTNIDSMKERIEALEKQYEKDLQAGGRKASRAVFKIHHSINASIKYNSHFNDVCRKDILENFFADKPELIQQGLAASEAEQESKKGVQLDSIIASTHNHHTNRNGEPHSHTHINFFGFGRDKEGKIRALNFDEVFKNRKEIGLFYQARLIELLNERGIITEKDKQGFKIEGISDELSSKFSERTNQINALADKRLKELEEKGYKITKKLRTQVKKQVTDELRQKKDNTPLEQLRKEWRNQALVLGYGYAQANAELNPSREQMEKATRSHHLICPQLENNSYLTKDFLTVIKHTSQFFKATDKPITEKQFKLQLQELKLAYPKLNINQTMKKLEDIGYIKRDGKSLVRNQAMILEFKEYGKELFKQEKQAQRLAARRERLIDKLSKTGLDKIERNRDKALLNKENSTKSAGKSGRNSRLNNLKSLNQSFGTTQGSKAKSHDMPQQGASDSGGGQDKGNFNGLSGAAKLKAQALQMKQQMHALAFQSIRATGKQKDELQSQAGALGKQADELFAQAEEMLSKEIER